MRWARKLLEFLVLTAVLWVAASSIVRLKPNGAPG